MRKLTFLFIIIFLVLIDIGTTSIYLQSHSLEHEVNPIIRYFVVIGGVNGIPLAMLFKSVISGFAFTFLAVMPGRLEIKYDGLGRTQSLMVLYAQCCQWFVIICYVAVAINNFYNIVVN